MAGVLGENNRRWTRATDTTPERPLVTSITWPLIPRSVSRPPPGSALFADEDIRQETTGC